MKKTAFVLMLMAGVALPWGLSACAGNGEMRQDSMQTQSNMSDTMKPTGTTASSKMSGTMDDTGMKDKAMGGSGMNDKTMADSKMMDKGMTSTRMSGDTMTAGKPMEKPMNGAMTAMLKGSDGHRAMGTVALTRQMGRYELVLSDLDVEKVPDAQVYLAKNGDRKQGIHLGQLTRFSGTATFALPAGTDPAAYDCVIIYCEKYHVEIGRAAFGGKM